MKNTRVEYAASDDVADVDRLINYVQLEIENHLRSINEVPIREWDLWITITKCTMQANYGEVEALLKGSVNGVSIEHWVAAQDQPVRSRRKGYMLANLFTYLGRLLFPSELVSALGKRRINGRLVRAWSDCLREIRLHLNEALGCPESGGAAQWRTCLRNALWTSVCCTAMFAMAYWIRKDRFKDEFRGQMSCVLIGIGVFGVMSSNGLLRLPDRFFQAERAGLRLVKLIGVKGLVGIRVVAVGLLLVSSLFFLVPGLWCFFYG
jgi:hypothetical protein